MGLATADAPPTQRIPLLQRLANIEDGTRLLDEESERADVFDLILRMPADLADMQIIGGQLRWTLQPYKYPGNLEMPCAEIRRRLQPHEHGIPRLDAFVKQARQIMNLWNASARQTLETATVQSVFPDALPADSVRVPSGYSMSRNRIVHVGSNEELIDVSPILIAERCRDLSDGVMYVTVAWLVDGKWILRVVPRAMIADRKKIVELAAFGLLCNSGNSPALENAKSRA